ncbi:MAG: hypothetical protein OIF57_10775 [Marinobacterium sp.]|nr:hypothetical protein [Marinobacterium sp.]
MQKRSIHRFVSSFIWGSVVTLCSGLVLLYSLNMQGLLTLSPAALPDVSSWLQHAWLNLRLSVIPFFLILLAWCYLLRRLKSQLMTGSRYIDVVRTDQLISLSISLFLGTGVIWTAIGMRSALLFALGDTASIQQQGAFDVLQRMVDGGILLALSTTIVGGIGGYLMRIGRVLYAGKALQEFLSQHESQPAEQSLQHLKNIERLLRQQRTVRRPSASPRQP